MNEGVCVTDVRVCDCVCVGVARAPGARPLLRGRAEDRDRGRPAGERNTEHMEETGWGWESAGSEGPRRAVIGYLERTDWLVVGRAHSDSFTCSLACSLGRRVGRAGPEGFVGLTGLAAPALLGWGLRVTVCAWSVSVWVGPL